MRIINLQLATIATAITIASVLSACGKSQQEVAAEPVVKPVVEKTLPPGTTKEIITLKGVSFDKPNVKEAVKELCVLPDGWGKDNTWCTFDKAGRISMPKFKFGNLSRHFMSMNLANAEIGENGALVYFWMDGTKAEMIELADLLSEKYGKPLVKDDQVENGLGTKFDKKTFVWVDSQGTLLTVKSIDGKVDEGSISINSASRLAKNAEAQIKQKNEAKSNL